MFLRSIDPARSGGNGRTMRLRKRAYPLPIAAQLLCSNTAGQSVCICRGVDNPERYNNTHSKYTYIHRSNLCKQTGYTSARSASRYRNSSRGPMRHLRQCHRGTSGYRSLRRSSGTVNRTCHSWSSGCSLNGRTPWTPLRPTLRVQRRHRKQCRSLPHQVAQRILAWTFVVTTLALPSRRLHRAEHLPCRAQSAVYPPSAASLPRRNRSVRRKGVFGAKGKQ